MNKLKMSKCYLRPVSMNDAGFISSLFSVSDVMHYYVVSPYHKRNIPAFVRFLVDNVQQGKAINNIIANNRDEEIGILTAELVRDDRTGEAIWNIGFALKPEHRGYGYVTEALSGFTGFLGQFDIMAAQLDISQNNYASIEVANRCGFKLPNGKRVGYFDEDNPEVGMRFKYYKNLHSARLMLFNEASNAFRNKQYYEAIDLFTQSLKEPFEEGTLFTDAQIYSNIGMAYSSMSNYQEAFKYLKRAQRLGLNNPSIEKELARIKIYTGLE